MFGGMGMVKGGLRCNSVIINVITYINYKCSYMQVFFLNISKMYNMYVHNKCIVPND